MTVPVVRRQPVLVMETGVNPVPGGTTAGWVSGNPSGLADGAIANCVFDLGPEWDQYPYVLVALQPVGATSFSAVTVSGSDTPANNYARRLPPGTTSAGVFNTFFATAISASGGVSATVRPIGRYVVVNVTNTAGSGAMGASKITLAAYPC